MKSARSVDLLRRQLDRLMEVLQVEVGHESAVSLDHQCGFPGKMPESTFWPTLHYVTGVFEGIRCYDAGGKPAIFQLEPHMERFARGTEALSMDVDVAALTEGIVETVAASGFKNAYIRPIAYFAAGGLGLDTEPLEPHMAVAVMPWKSHLGEGAQGGISVQVSRFRRNSARALPL